MFLVKINIDLILKFSKSVDFLFHRFNEFPCKISNFDEILFRKVDKFLLYPWKSNAQND